MRAGQYTIELAGVDPNVIKLDRDHVTLSRGKSEIVRITRRPELAGQTKAPPLAIAPFDFQQAKKHQEAWADYLSVPVERDINLPDGVKLTMMLIPPGEFMMGSTKEEVARLVAEAKAAIVPEAGKHTAPSAFESLRRWKVVRPPNPHARTT